MKDMKKIVACAAALMMALSSVSLPCRDNSGGIVVASALTEYSEAVTFSSNVTINDNVQINNGMTVTNGATVTINGDLLVEYGKLDIQNGTVIVTKNFAQNSYYNGGSTDVSGGTLDVKGDLWIGDKEFNVGSGKVVVGNNLCIAGGYRSGTAIVGYGKLVMNGSGTVDVRKNMLVKLPSAARYGKQLILTNGTLSVGGDLTVSVAGTKKPGTKYFGTIAATSPSHKTVLNGNGPQNVSIGNLKLGTVELKQNAALYTGDDISKVGSKVIYSGGGGPSTSSVAPTPSSSKAAPASSSKAPTPSSSKAAPASSSKAPTSSSSKAAPASSSKAPTPSSSKAAPALSSKAPAASSSTAAPISIFGASVTFTGSPYKFTGIALTPAPVVKLNGKTLTKDKDYRITGYSNNVNAGTASCTVEGIGAYTGTASGSFIIRRDSSSSAAGKVDISSAEITLANTEFDYTGSEIKPAVKIVYNGTKLSEGTDYKVTYIDNTSAGSALVYIEGIGGYKGSATRTFTIKTANSSKAPDSSKINDSRPADSKPANSTADSKQPDKKVKKGDVNRDGNINVTDIALVASHIKGIKALDEDGIKAADVDNDTKVNVTDIAMIASHIKGIKAIQE